METGQNDPNEIRQHAFNRAQAKLSAARVAPFMPPPCVTSQGLSSATSIAALAAVALIAFYLGGIDHPEEWVMNPTTPMAILVWTTVLVLVVVRWLKRRAMPSDLRTVHDFYEAVNGPVGRATLPGYVLEADIDMAPRRLPSFRPDAALPPIGAADLLSSYWGSLMKPEKGVETLLRVSKVSMLNLAPDLRLAVVKLRTAKGRTSAQFFTTMAIVLIWVFFSTEIQQRAGVWQHWALWAAVAAWAFVVSLVSHLFRGRGSAYTVNKLVVHSGGRWQMFCGDWEGWEEADLSWLDNVEQRADS